MERKHVFGYVFAVSAWIWGMAFIGAQVQLLASQLESLIFATICSFLYFVLLCGFTISRRLNRYSPIVMSVGIAFLEAVAVLVMTSILILTKPQMDVHLFSSRFYFYGVCFFAVVIGFTIAYFDVIKSVPFKTMEALKADISVRKELNRNVTLAFLMLMFGVAFLQVIAGTLGSAEMLLISFVSVGYVVFIVAPSLYTIYKRIELLDKKKVE